MEKPGVVIFNGDYFTDEGIAALHWASSVSSKLPKKPHVRILLVDKNKDKKASFGPDKGKEKLAALVERKAREKFGSDQKGKDSAIATFDDYIKNFGDHVEVRICKGDNINKILEGAIEEFELDTLVLGMAALGSTCKNGHLLLNSECSVMLVNIEGSKPLTTTKFEIIPPPKGHTTGATSSTAGKLK